MDRARRLYELLQAEFPASEEARLSHVSLGKLLLAAGRPAEADRELAAYLAQPGQLTEEALVGRAQSQERLGRRDDERALWSTLLRDFPASVYAAEARRRIATLQGERR
jgi:predicted Zn-dependent protease